MVSSPIPCRTSSLEHSLVVSLVFASSFCTKIPSSASTAAAAGAATAVSILDSDMSTPNPCRLPDQSNVCSSVLLSFVTLPRRQRPQQIHERWPIPTINDGEVKPPPLLRFWTRTHVDSDHEIIDENIQKEANATSDDETASDERIDDSHVNVEINLDYIAKNNVQIIADPNATNEFHNDTNSRVIAFGIDNITTQKRRDRWKRLSTLSSMRGLLPGKPLFMHLLPFKSSEIISKMIEETPTQNKVQKIANVEASSDREQTGCLNLQWETEYISESSLELKGGKDNSEKEESLQDTSTNATPFDIADGHTDETSSNSEQTPTISRPQSPTMTPSDTELKIDRHDHKQNMRRRFFSRKPKHPKNGNSNKRSMTKEEIECPFVATNIHELQSAVLVNNYPLKDIGFRFPAKGIGSDVVSRGNQTDQTLLTLSNNASGHDFSTKQMVFSRNDPVINGSLSSFLTCASNSSSETERLAIELMNLHPVLSIIRERVETNSKPGNRHQGPNIPKDGIPHLALSIEGGGMRGAVSAGMAAAISTLDLLDAFDSIHGSSAGAIVGAYLVSRQLCTDIYTNIMPAAGSQFASRRRGMVSFGVDWLGDLLQRKSYEEEAELGAYSADDGGCVADDELLETENKTYFSSVELAMGRKPENSSRALRPSISDCPWLDDHYDGVVHESANYLLSSTVVEAKSYVSKPVTFGIQNIWRVLRPALSALDFASSMRQYLKRRPGMNLTYVLDGVMDETHGLRPFDTDAFRANDKRQPLYIIASTVNKGGRGQMETVAFNSKDGDFFGLTEEYTTESSAKGHKRVSWYRRILSILRFVPYSIVSAVRRAFSSDTAQNFSPPMKDSVEYEMVPAGSSAMFGFTNRHYIRKFSRLHEGKVWEPTGRIDEEGKKGMFPCLEASMLVPGAAGPPIQLIRSKNRKFIEQRNRFPRLRPRQELIRRKESNSHICFDAFCFEPIPYRSAVEKANATHVMALRSRPDGCIVETKQHMYERVVGPIYFRKHGMNQVAKLFSSGGSQYRYIEDVLKLNEGLVAGIGIGRNDTFSVREYSEGVKVPPTQLFYGNSDNSANSDAGINDWKRAHLLPITLPYGTPELPALSQDKDEVVRAVRSGYAAAFDVLAPLAKVPFNSSTIPGEKVAKLLFPDGDDDIAILNKPFKVKPTYIGEDEDETKRKSFAAWITRKREANRAAKDEINAHPDGALARRVERRTSLFHETDQYVRDGSNTLEYIETEALLAALPGFRGGRLDHMADSLLGNDERKMES